MRGRGSQGNFPKRHKAQLCLCSNMSAPTKPPPVDIDKLRWDQRQFIGRLNHFTRITNPLLFFKPDKATEDAATLVKAAREGGVPPDTTAQQLYRAKVLYDSAYHPDTGEPMVRLGRMSAMVPAGTVLIGMMLALYRSTPEIVFAQWLNQSFNALLNYTNRNAKSDVSTKQLGVAYASATTAAVTVSVGMNSLVAKAPLVVKRWVPFTAVAVANLINIPLMRQRELIGGIAVFDEDGNEVAKSKRAAVKGISQVCFSRIFMVAPPMLLVPVIMKKLNPYFSKRGRLFSAVIETLFSGALFTCTVPVGCALFPQQSSMKTSQLEESLQREIQARGSPIPHRVYFNKGL